MNAAIDTIVIGAGAAGLMAALTLIRAGQKVLVVEARDRIGGRILTHHADVPMELGAEFVHGLPEITWTVLREAGLHAHELSGISYRYADRCLQPAADEPRRAADTLETMSRWYAAQLPQPDISFDQYLKRAGIEDLEAEQAARFVEGFNAADKTRIGVAALARQQTLEDEIHTDRMFHLPGGYDAVPRYLADSFAAAGGELRLSHPVSDVAWQRGSVCVYGSNPAAPIAARHAVVTLPLGVLKAGTVQFTPNVPCLRKSLQGLEMGPVMRLAYVFKREVWNELAPGMLFLLVLKNWCRHSGVPSQDARLN